MGNNTPISQERRRDKLRGLAIIILGFGACMALSLWGLERSMPDPPAKPAKASKEGLSGFPKKVNPFELLENARALTDRQMLQGFVATRVKADGTIDVSDKKSTIRYAFQSAKGRGYQPPRPPATLPDRRYCGVQSVVVNHKGIAAKADQPERPCGSAEVHDLPASKCSLADIWKAAKRNKIPGKGTAEIEYFDSFSGPAYRFKKGNKSLIFSAKQCGNLLKGTASRGGIPRE
jgi:hypothetical protein